jgi:HIRAN domain
VLVNAFGDEWMAVVGESHHADELDRVTSGGTGEHELVAHLVREPENPYDSNAIAVVVKELSVGYLSRENAGRFAAGLDAVGGRATCGAVIRRQDSARSWNVVLQVDYATLDSL